MPKTFIEIYQNVLHLLRAEIAQASFENVRKEESDAQEVVFKLDANMSHIQDYLTKTKSKNDAYKLVQQLFVNAYYEMLRKGLADSPYFKKLEEFLKTDRSLYFFNFVTKPQTTPLVYKTDFSILDGEDAHKKAFRESQELRHQQKQLEEMLHNNPSETDQGRFQEQLTTIDDRLSELMIQECMSQIAGSDNENNTNKLTR